MTTSNPLLLDGSIPRRAAGTLGAVLREHRVYLAIVAAYVLAGVIADETGLVPGLRDRMNLTLAYVFIPCFALLPMPVMLAAGFGRALHRAERAGGAVRWGDWPGLAREAVRATFPPERIARTALVVFTVPLLLSEFSAWKASLTWIQPFAWDARLSELDRILHFGRLPWQWLQPVVGYPPLSKGLDVLYGLWLYVVPAAVVYQAWRRDRTIRQRFFVTFALAWIVLGTVLAILLSSAGPAYFERVTGAPSPYSDLLTYLRQVDAERSIFAMWLQEWLWTAYLADGRLPFARISAMPSLHVAMVVLYVLAVWHAHPWLRLLFGGYALFIFIGSVHLGWHYAVDGYLSAAVVVLIWRLTAKLDVGG